jgi:hypothetical protein
VLRTTLAASTATIARSATVRLLVITATLVATLMRVLRATTSSARVPHQCPTLILDSTRLNNPANTLHNLRTQRPTQVPPTTRSPLLAVTLRTHCRACTQLLPLARTPRKQCHHREVTLLASKPLLNLSISVSTWLLINPDNTRLSNLASILLKHNLDNTHRNLLVNIPRNLDTLLNLAHR